MKIKQEDVDNIFVVLDRTYSLDRRRTREKLNDTCVRFICLQFDQQYKLPVHYVEECMDNKMFLETKIYMIQSDGVQLNKIG